MSGLPSFGEAQGMCDIILYPKNSVADDEQCRVYVSGFDGEGSVSTADKGSANEASKDVNLDADEAEELEFVDASEVMIVDSS